MFPQPAVDSRYKAAVEIRKQRRILFGGEAAAPEPDDAPRLAHHGDGSRRLIVAFFLTPEGVIPRTLTAGVSM